MFRNDTGHCVANMVFRRSLVLHMLGGTTMRSLKGFSGFSLEQAPAVIWVDLALFHSVETQGARMEKHCLLHRGAAAVVHMDLLCTGRD